MAATLGSLLRDLQAAFPRERITAETASLYARELADLPPGLLEQAVRDVIRTGTYFPTVAAIRQTAAEHALALPGEAAALAAIETRISWAVHSEGARPDVHPLVAEALNQVGGYAAWRTADKPGILRSQFLAVYRDLRARAIRTFVVGRALPAGVESKAIEEPESQ